MNTKVWSILTRQYVGEIDSTGKVWSNTSREYVGEVQSSGKVWSDISKQYIGEVQASGKVWSDISKQYVGEVQSSGKIWSIISKEYVGEVQPPIVQHGGAALLLLLLPTITRTGQSYEYENIKMSDRPIEEYSLSRYRTCVRNYLSSNLYGSVRRLRSGQKDELEELDRQIDRVEGLSAEVKAQLKKDMRWLQKWGPWIDRIGRFYLFASDFGAQMVISLFFTLLFVGILSLPLWTLFVIVYVLLFVTNFFRFHFGKAVARRVFLYMGSDLPTEQLSELRTEYAKATALQALSLLVALFFSLKIVMGNFPWSPDASSGMALPFIFDVMKSALSNLVALGIAALLSYLAGRGVRSVSPQGG